MSSTRKKSQALEKSLKILETGIELEKKGLMAYLKFAYASGSLTGKNMFIRLAADEFDHMKILENIKQAKIGNRPFRKPPLPMKEIEAMVPKLRRPELLEMGEDGLSDLDALKAAVEMEQKSANYYLKLAKEEKDKKIILLASDLAKWEEFHHDLLKAEIDFIKDSGFYFNLIQLQMKGKL